MSPILQSKQPHLYRDLSTASTFIHSTLYAKLSFVVKVVQHNFDLRPGKIVQELDLKKPIYQETSCYGHFGRDQFTWEKPKTLDTSIVTIPAQPARRRKRTDSACI